MTSPASSETTASRSAEFLKALENGIGNGATDFATLIAEQGEPSTERNRLRREAFFGTQFSICTERARYYTESFKSTEGEPQLIRMAKAFRHYLEHVTIVLNDNDLFAGYAGGKG